MSSTTRDAKDQPLEDENHPGRPAGPSRHWQTSADALYAMAREVSRLRGAVVTERHWCAEYLRGRETNLVKTRPPARHQPPATSPQHTTQHNTTHTKIWQLHAHQASESASPSSSCSCSSPLSSLLSSPPSPRGQRRLARLL